MAVAAAARVEEGGAPAGFDLSALADFPAASRHAPTPEEQDQALWLGEVIVEKAKSEKVEPPAFPTLAVQILKVVDSPEPDMRKLVGLIREDPMMSAMVLRMANSAYYSRGVEITTVHDAAVRLGIRAVANVAVAAATRSVLNAQEREYRDVFRAFWQTLWQYSIQSAAGARWLSVWLHRGDAEQCFLGGLLHDIGKVLALRVAGAMVHDGDMSPDVSAHTLSLALEAAHVGLGAELAFTWNLPGYVNYLCAEHHKEKPDAVPTNDALHLVRLASGLYEARVNPLHRASLSDELNWSAGALGLAPEPLMAIAAELKRLGSSSSDL